MEAGYYRVRLESVTDHDWLTAIVPLTTDGVLDTKKPGPWLFKAVWEGDHHYGEFQEKVEIDGRCYMQSLWVAEDAYSSQLSFTDFLVVPVAEKTNVTIWNEADLRSPAFRFTVRKVTKLT